MNRKQVYSVSSVNQYIKSLFMDDFALNHIYVRGKFLTVSIILPDIFILR